MILSPEFLKLLTDRFRESTSVDYSHTTAEFPENETPQQTEERIAKWVNDGRSFVWVIVEVREGYVAVVDYAHGARALFNCGELEATYYDSWGRNNGPCTLASVDGACIMVDKDYYSLPRWLYK